MLLFLYLYIPLLFLLDLWASQDLFFLTDHENPSLGILSEAFSMPTKHQYVFLNIFQYWTCNKYGSYWRYSSFSGINPNSCSRILCSSLLVTNFL